jgi:hypothetical protein
MPSRSMATNLPALAQVKTGEDDPASFTSAELDAQVARWFDEACAASKRKALDLADELGMRESYLSEMRSGRRSTPLRAFRVFAGNRQAVLALLEAIAADLLPGQLEIRPISRLTRKRAEVAMLRRLGKLQGIRRAVLIEAAIDEGVDVAELERALESEEP